MFATVGTRAYQERAHFGIQLPRCRNQPKGRQYWAVVSHQTVWRNRCQSTRSLASLNTSGQVNRATTVGNISAYPLTCTCSGDDFHPSTRSCSTLAPKPRHLPFGANSTAPIVHTPSSHAPSKDTRTARRALIYCTRLWAKLATNPVVHVSDPNQVVSTGCASHPVRSCLHQWGCNSGKH